MMESVSDTAVGRSRHQTIDGSTIFLYQRSLGNTGCMEYSIEKEKVHLWKSTEIYTFGLSFGSLFFCLSGLGSVAGAIILLLVSITILYNLLWRIEKEILLVTVPVGIQFTAVFRSGLQTTCFIPWHCVKDVCIVEAVSSYRVLYNLVVLQGSKSCLEEASKLKLVPLFQGTKPRLSCLESIYQSVSILMPPVKSGQPK